MTSRHGYSKDTFRDYHYCLCTNCFIRHDHHPAVIDKLNTLLGIKTVGTLSIQIVMLFENKGTRELLNKKLEIIKQFRLCFGH